ncbi:MAG: DUF1254 domain-containing protein [Pseudobdellovibrionaceae bacterium]
MFFKSVFLSLLSFSVSVLISSGFLSLSACTSSEKREEQIREEQKQKQLELQGQAQQDALKAQREAEAKLFSAQKPAELRLLVQDAVVYGYPLVLMSVSRQTMGNTNVFRHVRQIPDANTRGVINPSVDTLASTAWVDLSKEPMVLSVPATGQRYYMMSVIDAWTNVFASPGTRTSGNGPGNFVLVGPHWEGSLPVNVQKIQAPTSMALILAQTRVKGPQDYAVVHAIQNRFRLTPLSEFSRTMAPLVQEPKRRTEEELLNLRGTPINIVASMDAATFLTRLSQLMKENPPAAEDQEMLGKLAKIGVTPGRTVDFAQLPPEVMKILDQAVQESYARVAELAQYIPGRVMNGWVSGSERGNYGNNYEARAATALMGLGVPLAEDAIFPTARVDAEGMPLTGEHNYVLHFAKGKWPPVNAFWSLTLYNSRQSFVDNSLKRYSLGSKNKLVAKKDGSLNIYIQSTDPGKAKRANWLPAPSGEFSLMLRLYWPQQAALNGEWQAPAIEKQRPLRRQRLTQKMAGTNEWMIDF